jgi:hypothetical protein
MKPIFRKLLWGALGIAVVLCLALELLPRQTGPSRLEKLPLKGFGFAGRELPLNEAEKTIFQRAKVVKRLYQAGANQFVLLAVDGGGDRHAIHDPLYCFRGAGWTVVQEVIQPIPGGHGKVIRLTKKQQSAQALFWISDGQSRHASALNAWGQSMRARLGISSAARTPVLVLVQPIIGGTVDWPDLIHRCPELFAF